MTLHKTVETERRRVMGARYLSWIGGFTCCVCDHALIDVDEFHACPQHWDLVVSLVRATGGSRTMAAGRVMEFA